MLRRLKVSLIILLLFISASAFPQASPSNAAPINWQLLDWQTDGYPGISVEKTYKQLLANKKPLKRIVVAVIDDGLDSSHADLTGVQWTNQQEIPGNGIDDDHNGYVDDIHGWNFVGDNRLETFEEVREFVRLKSRFENRKDTASLKSDPQYPYWKTIVEAKNHQIELLEHTSIGVKSVTEAFQTVQNYWKQRLSADSVPFSYIKYPHPYEGADSSVLKAKDLILSFKDNVASTEDNRSLNSIIREIRSIAAETDKALGAADTVLAENDPAFFRKKYVHDDPYAHNTHVYGNNNTFPDDKHGTECAGVIAAGRENNLGGKGITNSVLIMPLRINAMGHACDEWDKDVANAIRYAADNGAQVISMSFGKFYSPQKKWVEQAMKYAASKGVLLVRAAGNNSLNTDSATFYPFYDSPEERSASNLLVVGASTYDSSLVGGFSNYGVQTVDVFAPGVSIYMPVPGGKYESDFGTSFACPVVAGLAAFLWSYYPGFTYQQIRTCIEQSAMPIQLLVTKPGTNQKVPFLSLSRQGGIVNAYRAFIVAAEISGAK